MDNNQLVKLKVLGITRSEVQAGAYALLLETDGESQETPRRIPIVVGVAEAQSIAVYLERIVTSRPLTHDLFTSLFHAYGIELERVVIHNFSDGVFASLMQLNNGTLTVDIDARTSDAVAIALRTGAPIYTTQQIVEQTSYVASRDDGTGSSTAKPRTLRLEDLPIDKLERRMQRYVEREQYERAAEIQKIIASKTDQPQQGEEAQPEQDTP